MHDPSVDFTLSESDAEALRHLAKVTPLEARRYLQDRPELAHRMTGWPPEIRLEVCRILYRSFPEDRRRRLRERRAPWSDLIEQLERDD